MRMLVKEMHPLCCISAETPATGFHSPEPTLSRTGSRFPVEIGYDGLDGNAAGSEGGFAGFLYKWTNYSKGWRSRWFVLRSGVLSYYRILIPENLTCLHSGDDVHFIGDVSAGRLSRLERAGGRSRKNQRHRTVGVVHLKVSSFRESRSDAKRFYIFTASKTLHLRTSSERDKVAWIEALVSSQNLYYLRRLNDDASFVSNDISVSTDRLKKRLLEEGSSNELVKDCEQIMLLEFSEISGQFKVLCKERSNLLDSLRQMEAGNIEVQDPGNDDSEYQLTKHEVFSLGRQKYNEWSTTASSDDVEKQELVEVLDEEENIYFDTKEHFSESSSRCLSVIGASDQADVRTEPKEQEHDNILDFRENCNPSFPKIERRKKLPDPVEKEKGVSLWSLIKDNVGKDLTRVCLPVYFNEPISSLQKCFEDLEYSHLLDSAYEHGKRVSHHPTLIACHCEGSGWKFWGESNLRTRFWGTSIHLDPVGTLTLEFDDGEVFQWCKVTTTIGNLLIGKVYLYHHGTMHIRGNRQYSCKLKFKEQSILDRNPHQVHGFVEDVTKRKVATVFGKWDDSMYYMEGDGTGKQKDVSKTSLLWKRSEPCNLTRYKMTPFAITLNELTPGLQEKLPPTDSRLRPDQRHLENGEYEKSNLEKQRLEMRQRMSRKMQENGWKPRWFYRDGEEGPFRYSGGYWEAREQGKWNGCPDIYGEFNEDLVNSIEGC